LEAAVGSAATFGGNPEHLDTRFSGTAVPAPAMAAWEFRRQQTARKAVRELERWGCGSAEGDGNEAVTKVEGSAVESPAKRKSAGEKLLIAGEWKQNEKCWTETG
jgi:hypothetical protein